MKTCIFLIASLFATALAQADICTTDVKETHFIKTKWNKKKTAVALLYCPKTDPAHCTTIGSQDTYALDELELAAKIARIRAASSSSKTWQVLAYAWGAGVIGAGIAKSPSPTILAGTIGSGAAVLLHLNSSDLENVASTIELIANDTRKPACVETPRSAESIRDTLNYALLLMENSRNDYVGVESELSSKNFEQYTKASPAAPASTGKVVVK